MARQSFDISALYWETSQMDDAFSAGVFSNINNPAGSDRIILSMLLVSNDTIDHVITFSRSNDTSATIGSVLVPAGAGYGTVPPVDVLSVLCDAGRRQLWLDSQGTIYWAIDVVLSSSKVLNAYWEGGYF